MEQRYAGVISRTLDRTERRIRINEEETPLVIEPLESSSAQFLREFLTCYSRQILEDIAKHGALLLRGFDVDSAGDFEKHIHSIQGMWGMREYLFSEEGRTLADESRFVFFTNTLKKSGGTLHFGGFHTENHAVPEVPHYVSFWCQTPSTLGGETGLVNLAKVYADLPDALKRNLEERACLLSLYSITRMTNRYGVRADRINEFCNSAGLPIVAVGDRQYVAIYRSNVVQHPLTQEKSLLFNSFYLPSIEHPLLHAFLPDYAGLRWLMHRLVWTASWLRLSVSRRPLRRMPEQDDLYVTKAPPPLADARVFSAIFSDEDCRMLSAIMRRRYSSFPWRRGDILILDNLKIAHSGMPGRGDRELKVMLCNPLSLPSSGASPGLHVVADSNGAREPLSVQLARFRD
jgi:alpha-ketoglutarate-dependent taurine dioxygenase